MIIYNLLNELFRVVGNFLIITKSGKRGIVHGRRDGFCFWKPFLF
jgi:hypothetical protein